MSEMVKKTDEVLCICKLLGIRKNAITTLLEGELIKPIKEGELESIWNTGLQLDTNGQLLSSPVLNSLRSSAEPLLLQFIEDLVAIRAKVTLILSNISNSMSTVTTEGADPSNTIKQLMTIIKVLENMDLWTNKMMSTWIEYHITRNKLKRDIDSEKLMADSAFQKTDDMCQAIILGDCMMAKEMKSMLNTLLFHYITLEDIKWSCCVKTVNDV